LGAAALGDIGTHFPDSDPKWSGAPSLNLLSKVVELVDQHGFGITNIDATVIVERPKLKTYIDSMREQLASVLRIPIDRVSIKAKTNEGLDSVGRNEAIAAQAVVLIHRRDV
jgi:2-C-methyl-D-erythritol 2,4-cyclodiphosphate synthase